MKLEKIVQKEGEDVVRFFDGQTTFHVFVEKTGWRVIEDQDGIGRQSAGLTRQDVERLAGICEEDRNVNQALDRLVTRQRRLANCL